MQYINIIVKPDLTCHQIYRVLRLFSKELAPVYTVELNLMWILNLQMPVILLYFNCKLMYFIYMSLRKGMSVFTRSSYVSSSATSSSNLIVLKFLEICRDWECVDCFCKITRCLLCWVRFLIASHPCFSGLFYIPGVKTFETDFGVTNFCSGSQSIIAFRLWLEDILTPGMQ